MRFSAACFVAPVGALVACGNVSAAAALSHGAIVRRARSPPRRRPRTPIVVSFGDPDGDRSGSGGGDGPSQSAQARVADAILRTGSFLKSSNGQVVLWGALVWLVVTGRAGFLFDSFLFLAIFISVVPVVGLFVFRWWVSSRVTSGTCPNCGADVTGLRGQSFQCMSCGQVVMGDGKGDFSWGSDPSSATIDIDAKTIDID
jgi:hypothetical protein